MIDKERGLILTNSHCISGNNSKPMVKIGDSWYQTEVIAKAKEQEAIDICLLKLKNHIRFSLKNSIKFDMQKIKNLKEGDTVYAVGFGIF